MSHMKNRCTHLPPIVRGFFVIAVRIRPGPRPSEFRRHRGWEYAHIDGVHPTYVHGIMERTLHYILAHVVHSPLSLSPCRSCSPPPPLPPPHLSCAPLLSPSCMRRLRPPCSDPMHQASPTPLHLRFPHLHPLELHISCNALAQTLPPPSSSHLDTNPSIRLCYFQSSTAMIPFSAFPILDFYVSACSTFRYSSVDCTPGFNLAGRVLGLQPTP
ncbi:hypothetical protein B0H14DRAFT_2906845 [Mycena olivaceomarginata]|nr:hypothetical protein B0H14DRAFT_2906845 [Mycena olivaceomarginata]